MEPKAQSDIPTHTMRSIAKQSNQRTAAQAPVMNDCRITPAAHPTYKTYETTSLIHFGLHPGS
jgi:hypothetical protein